MSDDTPVYPPSGHIIRHLRLDLQSDTTDELRCSMPVSSDLRDEGGVVRFGALATMVDVAAGTFSHDLVRPDWLATSDMKMHVLRSSTSDEVRSLTTTVRAGKRMVLSLNIVEDDEGEIARSWVTYVRLPRRGDSPTIEKGTLTGRRLLYVEKGDTGRSSLRPDGSERLPLDDYIGFEPRSDQLVFDLVHRPPIHNSFGSIQGGVASMMVERMAMHAAEQHLGGPTRVTDLHMFFLGQSKQGPFRIEGNILRADDDSVTSEVTIVDAGNEDRILDHGTATAVRIPEAQLR